MRDDIHNKAPISAALRAVLKHALRPADQQRPDRLRDLAVRALARDLKAQMTPRLVAALASESRDLFAGQGILEPTYSHLEADVGAQMEAAPAGSMQSALRSAAADYIRSLCNESEAAMIAGGGNRYDVARGVAAFERALHAATPLAAAQCAGEAVGDLPTHRVTLEEPLALGRKARQ